MTRGLNTKPGPDAERCGDEASHGNEARDRAPSENGERGTAADRDQGQGPLLKRFSIFATVATVLIALVGLLGCCVPGMALLGSASEGYVPMAPSTAICFIVLGSVLLCMTLRRPSNANLILYGTIVALVSLFCALDVAGHFTGRDLNFEGALVPSAGYLGEIPLARMSPATGTAFLLAGLAILALVLESSGRTRRFHFKHWAGCLGSLTLVVSFVFCLA